MHLRQSIHSESLLTALLQLPRDLVASLYDPRRLRPASAAREMHLAALPHRTLKATFYGIHHACLIVAHCITHPAASVLLQLADDRASSGFRLALGIPAVQHFVIARYADPDSLQNTLTYRRVTPSHLPSHTARRRSDADTTWPEATCSIG